MMSTSPRQPTREQLEQAKKMFQNPINTFLQNQQTQQTQLEQPKQTQISLIDSEEELSLKSIISTKPKTREVRQFFRENVNALNADSDGDSLDY